MTPKEQEDAEKNLRVLEQSHEKIEALLRDEIESLYHQRENFFKEIALLCARLDLCEDQWLQGSEIGRLLSRSRQYRPGFLKLRLTRLPSLQRQCKALQKSSFFDADWYRQVYGLERKTERGAILHYVRTGAFEGQDPGPNFSSLQYYLANKDVAEAGWPALVHYEMLGRTEGRPLVFLRAGGAFERGVHDGR